MIKDLSRVLIYFGECVTYMKYDVVMSVLTIGSHRGKLDVLAKLQNNFAVKTKNINTNKKILK